MIPLERPTLEYGGVATRWGVTCDSREDGVTITLPATLASTTRGAEHMLVALAIMIIWIVRRIMRLPEPPRMILELNRNEFRIEERTRNKTNVRTWPRESVGELRANRYSRGLLVRIPGKDNFDMLGDCSNQLIQWIGEELTAALERTKPGSSDGSRRPSPTSLS